MALPEPRTLSRCGRLGKSESGSPRSVAAKRSVSAILEFAERTRAARTAQRSSFPTSPTRRAGRSRRVRPLRVCPLRACPRTSAETPACRCLHPGRQLPVRGGAGIVRPTTQPQEVSGGRPRREPQPKDLEMRSRGLGLLLTAEPLSPSPGCPWPPPCSWSRLTWRDGTARRDAAHRHRCRRLRGPTPWASSPPGRPPAALEPGEPARRAPAGTNFMCAHPPALTRSRARTHNRPHEPPDTHADVIGCRKCVALFSSSSLKPAPSTR